MRITNRLPVTALAALLAAAMAHGCGPSSDDAGRVLPRDTVLAVNGTELYVHTEGTGEPVMVVHGGPMLDHGYLVEPLRPLAGSYELVFHDQRLSGRSAGTVDSASVRLDTLVADIEAVRRELELGRINLMGHSWGGLLAMRYATLHPENLRSLILVSPMPPSTALWQQEQLAQAEALMPEDTAGVGALRSSPEMAAGDPATIEAVLRLSFRASFHDPARVDELDLYVPDDYMARSRQFAYLGGDLRTYDLRDQLRRLAVPTLLVYGGDEVGTRIGRDALVAAIPHTTAVAIADAGHFPFIERPAEFTRVVRAFLDGVNPKRVLEREPAGQARLRNEMVERQVVGRGIRDTAVLRAMRTVPRHVFVPEAPPEMAYTDRALPIGHGQTISQPYIVAYMAEAARIQPGDRVLEIGTGSGYGAAVLAELAAEVYSIEIVPELAERARSTLARAGYGNVHVKTGNGWLGWPEHAPFDAVLVTAAPDEVPAALVDQTRVDGMLVVPVGGAVQNLRVLRKTAEALREEASLPARFVPMVGAPPDTTG